MARITTVAVALCLLAVTLTSSIAAAGALQDPDDRPSGPVRVPLGVVEARGLVHHERSERLVVALDDRVEIFDLQGRPTATIDGIPGAMGPVEAGEFVVVGSPAARELVVVEPTSGAVIERIGTGARGLSAIAAAGDRIWFAHDQWPDGIGVASIAEATAAPSQDLGRLEVVEGVEIGVLPSRPGRVYLKDPATDGLRWAHRDGGGAEAGWSGPITSFLLDERGDVVWALTAEDGIVELDAETLGPTGFRLAPPERADPAPDRTGGGPGLIAGHGGDRLAVALDRTVTHYHVDDPTPATSVQFAGLVTALDIAERDLFVVVADDGRSEAESPTSGGTQVASEILIMDRDDAAPTPALDLAFFGFGDPSTPARGTARLSCGGQLTIIPIRYGAGLELAVPADARTCELAVVGGPTPQRRRLMTTTSAARTDLGVEASGRSPAEPITVRISGISGNDRIQVVDTYRSVVTDPAILTEQVFADLLDRAPTAAERSSWTTALKSGAAPGALTADLITAGDFQAEIAPISRLYLAYFGREADDAGLAYWLGRIRSGATIDEVSWAFAASAEFDGGEAETLSDAQFVELLYRRVLGRPAEPEGAAYWTGALAGGASRSLVVSIFADSPEFARRSEPAIAVRWLYRGLLDREPDPAAGLYWRAVAQTGGSLADLVEHILESPEYEERFWLRDPLGPLDRTTGIDGVRLEARSSPAWSGPELLPVDRR